MDINNCLYLFVVLHYDKPLTNIKFFRKTKQNLLSEGKTGKYLKYAISEIVLVVIGFLIALQLNNAKENWHRKKLRQELLIELRSNMMQDTVALNREKNKLTSAYIKACY